MIFYTDPTHGDLLPINNDENLAKAISLAKPLLRLFLQRKGKLIITSFSYLVKFEGHLLLAF